MFIPERYRQTIFGFVQNNVVRKEDIGKKITGDGLIAITNWHLLSGENEEEGVNEETEISPLENPEQIVWRTRLLGKLRFSPSSGVSVGRARL